MYQTPSEWRAYVAPGTAPRAPKTVLTLTSLAKQACDQEGVRVAASPDAPCVHRSRTGRMRTQLFSNCWAGDYGRVAAGDRACVGPTIGEGLRASRHHPHPPTPPPTPTPTPTPTP